MVFALNSLYYDGDSFSCLLPAGQYKTTAHCIAEKLGFDLDHYGFVGKNHDKILRTAMRYSFDHSQSLMLIGVGVTQRLEVHGEDVDKFDYPYKYFHEEHCVRPLQGKDVEQFADLLEWQYVQTTTLFDIVLLHDYLEHKSINFLIHNLGFDFYKDDEYNFANGIENQVRARPKLLNFYENSLHSLIKDANIKPWDYDEYGWNGHPDEQGHAMYADYLMEHINV